MPYFLSIQGPGWHNLLYPIFLSQARKTILSDIFTYSMSLFLNWGPKSLRYFSVIGIVDFEFLDALKPNSRWISFYGKIASCTV